MMRKGELNIGVKAKAGPSKRQSKRELKVHEKEG